MKAHYSIALLLYVLLTSQFTTFGNSFKNTLGFEENKGQILSSDGTPAPDVLYRFNQGNTQIFLTNKGIAYQFTRIHYPEELTGRIMDKQNMREIMELKTKTRVETHRMNMIIEGADVNAQITAEGKSHDFINYYNRNITGVHRYQKITYHNIYPGIDWIVYTNKNGIKYDFAVRPGADPNKIKLKFEHHDELYLDRDGNLIHRNSLGNFTENKPVSFQNEKEINTNFILENNILTFAVDDYDPSKTLIIDPMRIWATYYGGLSDEDGNSCATDADGNVYLAGTTASTTDIAFNGYQNSLAGITYDAFIVKFDSSGVRIWATYFGGTSGDFGYQITIDNNNNIILTGTTQSTDLVSLPSHQPNYGGGSYDAFLAKFNSAGNLLWSTYYGGLGDDEGYSTSVDGNGNIYLAGSTSTTTDIALSGHMNTYGGNTDAFLVKFDSSGVRQWGTYYGTQYPEEGYFCATDGLGNVYLTGVVGQSSTFDIAFGGHQNTHAGGTEAYLVKFNPNGVREWGTYYGGSANDIGYSIASDSNDNIYLAGLTHSTNNISFNGHQNTHGGSGFPGGDAYLVKFDNSGARIWATYYGGNQGEDGYFCTVDMYNNVYLTGYTESLTNIAFNGHQNSLAGGIGNADAFLVKFNENGVRQWGTYYGGTPDDYGFSIATDLNNNVYIAGSTRSDTDIAFNGHQNTFAGLMWDAFLVKFEGGLTTSIADLPIDNFNVYPNPVTNGQIIISSDELIKNLPIDIEIVDILGRKLDTENIIQTGGNNSLLLQIRSNIPSGLYSVRIKSGAAIFVKKILILSD